MSKIPCIYCGDMFCEGECQDKKKRLKKKPKKKKLKWTPNGVQWEE